MVVLVAAALLEDGKMNVKRILKHLFYPPWLVKRYFPPATLNKIEAAIAESELTHCAEIRFAVESALELSDLLADKSSFERGVDVFSQLRVWDTEQNNGVLIYLLLADRKIEIIADRGVYKNTRPEQWQQISQIMEKEFRNHRYEQGILTGIQSISRILAKLYPYQQTDTNELSNKPVIL